MMVNKSPKDRVVGPLPNGRASWLINGGDPKHLRPSWDDPPSTWVYVYHVSKSWDDPPTIDP